MLGFVFVFLIWWKDFLNPLQGKREGIQPGTDETALT